MSVPPNQITKSYRQEDIQQILQLAFAVAERSSISGQDRSEEMSRDQLLEIAAELDIPLESLELAEREWFDRKGELQKRQEFNLYRRNKFKKKFGSYLIVNAVLVLLNLVSAGTLSWSLYVLLLWGLGLGLNVWNIYQETDEEYEQAFQKWYSQKNLRRSLNSLWDKLNKGWQS